MSIEFTVKPFLIYVNQVRSFTKRRDWDILKLYLKKRTNYKIMLAEKFNLIKK